MILLNSPGIIGLTGYATSGKDYLFGLLANRGPVIRMALADSLKRDINPFLIEKFGIDLYSCTPEQKELVRPLLVAYGKIHRNRSGGSYFTSQLTKKVLEASKTHLVVVTDIRYADPKFPNDELNWLKSLGGKLVHITKYNEENGQRTYVKAPNADELENNIILLKNADFLIEWKHTSGSLSEVNAHADRLVSYLNEQGKRKD